MANFQCGDARVEVYASKSFNYDKRRTYVSGVTVNVTTTGGDGEVTYQTYTLNYDMIVEVTNCPGLIYRLFL